MRIEQDVMEVLSVAVVDGQLIVTVPSPSVASVIVGEEK